MNLLENWLGVGRVLFYSINICHDGGAPLPRGGFADGDEGTFIYENSGHIFSVCIYEHVAGAGKQGSVKVEFKNIKTGASSRFRLQGTHNYARSLNCPGIYIKHGNREINPGYPLTGRNNTITGDNKPDDNNLQMVMF